MKLTVIPPVWGVTFAAAGFVTVGLVFLFGGTVNEPLLNALFVSVRFAFWGVLFGLLFTGAAALLGPRLRQPHPVAVCAVAGVSAGILAPLIMQSLSIVSGDGPVAWADVTDDVLWAVPFGALAAYVSLRLAAR